jgi:alpha-ketoglutarate-dependent taurine dioxygenase
MNIENIYPDWGTKIKLENPEEFFNQPSDFWRNFIYERKLIVFDQVHFTKSQYAEFGMRVGDIWTSDAYKYSREVVENVETPYGNLAISPFSNHNSRLITNEFMPWHADIPNRSFKPFPFRSLWITAQDNSNATGKTAWLNLEKAIDFLTPEMKDMIPRVRIVQQSWYEKGTDIQEFDLLKIHPVTGVPSLRLNYYNWGDVKNAWIIDVKIDGVSQGHCLFVRQWLNYLQQFKELMHTHTWNLHDIVLYDNWSFVHGRSALQFSDTSGTRHFYRLNIDHLDPTEWADHKLKYNI